MIKHASFAHYRNQPNMKSSGNITSYAYSFNIAVFKEKSIYKLNCYVHLYISFFRKSFAKQQRVH